MSDDDLIHPERIRLEASSHCQLRCPSCPTTTGAIRGAVGSGFLSSENLRGLLADNPGIRSMELSNYGEILLNPELIEILALCHERGVAVSAGNGVNLNRLTDALADALVRYGMHSMVCSIDGASEETYQKYRVRGSFEAVIANIRKINECKERYASELPRLIWQFVAFGHNEHEIQRARGLAADLEMDFRLKLTWDDDFSPLRDPAMVRMEAGVGAATRDEYTRLNGGRDYQEQICHQLWDQPQINWDGRVLGCCRNFWMNFGGNAFEDGLEAVVNHETMRYARRMLVGEAEPRADIPCSTCDLYLKMKGQGRRVERSHMAGSGAQK